MYNVYVYTHAVYYLYFYTSISICFQYFRFLFPPFFLLSPVYEFLITYSKGCFTRPFTLSVETVLCSFVQLRDQLTEIVLGGK